MILIALGILGFIAAVMFIARQSGPRGQLWRIRSRITNTAITLGEIERDLRGSELSDSDHAELLRMHFEESDTLRRLKMLERALEEFVDARTQRG